MSPSSSKRRASFAASFANFKFNLTPDLISQHCLASAGALQYSRTSAACVSGRLRGLTSFSGTKRTPFVFSFAWLTVQSDGDELDAVLLLLVLLRCLFFVVE